MALNRVRLNVSPTPTPARAGRQTARVRLQVPLPPEGPPAGAFEDRRGVPVGHADELPAVPDMPDRVVMPVRRALGIRGNGSSCFTVGDITKCVEDYRLGGPVLRDEVQACLDFWTVRGLLSFRRDRGWLRPGESYDN